MRHIKLTDPGQNLFVNGNLTSPAAPNNVSKTIYSVSARYRFTPDFMVYASTGSSLRPGAHAIGDFSAIFSPNEIAHTKIDPETSKSYEIGFKSDWLDKKVIVNLTYYHQTFTNYPFRAAGDGIFYLNYQTAASTPTVGHFNFISAVPVKVDGVEGEVDFRPSEHFYLNSSINYSKSKIGNAQLACNLVAGSGVPTVAQMQAAFAAAGTPNEHLGVCNGGGQAANFQPNWSGTFQGEYSHAVGGTIEGFVRGLVSWRGKSQNDPNNPYDDIGAYALVNAYVGVRSADGGWALTFYGKNLADTVKVSTLNGAPYNLAQNNVNVSGGSIPATTFISNYGGVSITPPREFGVNLRVAFGSR